MHLSLNADAGAANPMCDKYWERELARRWKLLATEDETTWLPILEPEDVEEPMVPVVLPRPLAVEERKRLPRTLAH